VYSGKNIWNFHGINDSEYSYSLPLYILLNLGQTFKSQRFGFKKSLKVLGIHRRAKTLKQVSLKEKSSFIYSHQLTSTGIVSYFSGIPYVVTIWGSDFNKFRFSKELKDLSQQTLENAELIHVLSQRQNDILIEEGLPRDKIFIQNFGVEYDRFLPKLSKNELKNQLGYNRKTVIFAPRGHSQYYRPTLLLKVIKHLLPSISELKVIVTGEYDQTPELKREAKQLGLDNSIDFVGRVKKEEYIQYNQMADIYLQTPEMEGVTVSVMESLASGTPPVSSNVGDASTNIKHGYNGLLIDGDDVSNYADQILGILNNKSVYEDIRMNGLKWAKEHCDREKSMNNIVKQLRRISSQLKS
jgi:glycosyltransferase involved in cell wall biosynthesis